MPQLAESLPPRPPDWNRSRSVECSGALVWQLNEPWPGAHNTSVLDHDLGPKLAYYRCREANAPTALHWGMEPHLRSRGRASGPESVTRPFGARR
ncbi:hypothetical protein [Deinococcus yunweiensis]|uniref:hypothetical protein n=1 Tax=Deinococcus yunweiensis TaxID=367282 RepID=UPI00398F2F80